MSTEEQVTAAEEPAPSSSRVMAALIAKVEDEIVSYDRGMVNGFVLRRAVLPLLEAVKAREVTRLVIAAHVRDLEAERDDLRSKLDEASHQLRRDARYQAVIRSEIDELRNLLEAERAQSSKLAVDLKLTRVALVDVERHRDQLDEAVYPVITVLEAPIQWVRGAVALVRGSKAKVT